MVAGQARTKPKLPDSKTGIGREMSGWIAAAITLIVGFLPNAVSDFEARQDRAFESNPAVNVTLIEEVDSEWDPDSFAEYGDQAAFVEETYRESTLLLRIENVSEVVARQVEIWVGDPSMEVIEKRDEYPHHYQLQNIAPHQVVFVPAGTRQSLSSAAGLLQYDLKWNSSPSLAIEAGGHWIGFLGTSSITEFDSDGNRRVPSENGNDVSLRDDLKDLMDHDE